jgi:hypothetical protein
MAEKRKRRDSRFEEMHKKHKMSFITSMQITDEANFSVTCRPKFFRFKCCCAMFIEPILINIQVRRL